MSAVIRLDGSWLTSAEAAQMMGCSVGYLHRLNHLGALTPIRVGTRFIMYRRRDIERYIETHPRLGLGRSAATG